MSTKQLPKLYTRATFLSETYNPEEHTVELVFTTGAKGLRRSFWGEAWYEELEVSEQAVILDRLNAGAPLLNTHQSDDLKHVFGVVERAWIANGEGRAVVRFSTRDEVAPYERDVAAGIIRNVSAGYFAHEYTEIQTGDGDVPTFRGTKWEPAEISLVPVPFDAGAQVRSSEAAESAETFDVVIRRISTHPAAPGGPTEEHRNMPNENKQNTAGAGATTAAPNLDEVRAAGMRAERERASEIQTLVRMAGLPVTRAQDLIDAGTRIEEARVTIQREWQEMDQTRMVSAGAPDLRVTRDEGETRMRAMENALIQRVSPSFKLSDVEREAARQYRHMSLQRMAEESLAQSGVNVRGLSGYEIASRALHSTSDFPKILAAVTNKRLRSVYEEAPTTYQLWARRAPNAPDFKNIHVLQLGAAPDLEQVGEGGEFKYGTVGEGEETYKVLTYGKIVGFTRQAIINDDLRSFDRIVTGFAASARRLENRLVYKQLTGNPKMADGTDLFHASRGNLAGTGAAISATTLGAGRAAMRKQKGLAGEELNITPTYLLVPTDLEQVAYQYTSSQYTPAKSTDINEFRAGGRTAIEPIVDPVLDTSSATAWYLVGDGLACDTVEYCWLDGAEGVFLESEPSFDVDGMKLKARLDFGAKVVDHRAVYQNPGS